MIKEFKDAREFEGSGRNFRELDGLAVEVDVVVDSSRYANSPTLNAEFWKVHRGALEYRPKRRRACAVFYLIGFLLLGWVFISNLGWVIRELS